MTSDNRDQEAKWLEPRDFDDVLYRLRQSAEQVELQKRQSDLIIRSWLLVLLFGALLALAVYAWLMGAAWWIVVATMTLSVMAVVTADKKATTSRKIAKDQDRRYFLAAIREAQSIDELNRAGLFAFLEHRVGEGFEKDKNNEVQRLRSALDHRLEEVTDWKTKSRKYDPVESDRVQDELKYLSGEDR